MLGSRYRWIVIFVLANVYDIIYLFVIGKTTFTSHDLANLTFLFGTSVVVWHAHWFFLKALDNKLPYETRTIRKRFAFQAGGTAVVSLTVASICFYIYVTYIYPLPYTQWIFPLKMGLVTCVLFNLLLTAGEAEVAFIKNWKENELEVAKLRELNSRSQLESLKNQINPHFFFNNLNILSVLIDQSQDLSKEFIDKFSDVFRYILQSNKKELVKLGEELEFINAYVFLLKIRFNHNLDVSILVSDEVARSKHLPPVVLHTLVENAIKHNVISEKHRLHIEIRMLDETYLGVINTIQKKTIAPVSTRLGLEGIKKRFEFYTSRQVVVEEDERHFQVKVPLIETVHEYINH